jgi:UDP-N-acetylglucosamine transferase subunit ALG13
MDTAPATAAEPERRPPPSAEATGPAPPPSRPALLVCSSGGHLTQLLALRHWWGARNRAWVTSDSAHARSALHGEPVSWGYFPTTRNAVNLVRNSLLAMRLLIPPSRRPSVIISTGAGLALPFFVLGRLIRIPTVYIEVFGRVDSRTLTGRLCRPFTSLFLVQWEEQRALYRGAVLAGQLLWDNAGQAEVPAVPGQGHEHAHSPADQAPLLFVTVGTDHHPFTRLITWIQRWLDDGGDQRVRVLIQHGATPVENGPGRVRQLDYQELQETLRSASVVITHAGATAMEARSTGRLPVIVPRRSELGEHVDGHQLKFGRWLAAEGLAVICNTESELRDALDHAVTAAGAQGTPAVASTAGAALNGDYALVVPAGALRAGELIDTLLAGRSRSRRSEKPSGTGRSVDVG